MAYPSHVLAREQEHGRMLGVNLCIRQNTKQRGRGALRIEINEQNFVAPHGQTLSHHSGRSFRHATFEVGGGDGDCGCPLGA